MTRSWLPKAPGDVVTYVVDWAQELGPLDPVTASVATVNGVTLDSQSHTTTTSTVTLSGGADQTIGTVSFAITVASNPVTSYTREFSLLIADTVEGEGPSTATKRTILQIAFEEMGLAGYEFDATPEELSSGLRRMDALADEWASPGVGINLPYNRPAVFGQGDLDDVSGVPDFAINTFAMALGFRLAPTIGKTMPAESRAALAQGMAALRTTYAVIPNRTLPRSTPLGAGRRPWVGWSPFAGGGD